MPDGGEADNIDPLAGATVDMEFRVIGVGLHGPLQYLGCAELVTECLQRVDVSAAAQTLECTLQRGVGREGVETGQVRDLIEGVAGSLCGHLRSPGMTLLGVWAIVDHQQWG